MLALHGFAAGFLRAVQVPGGGQALVQQRQPVHGSLTAVPIHKRSNGSRPERQNVFQFQQREAAEADRRLVHERIGVRKVAFERRFNGWEGFLIKTQHQFLGRRRAKDFVEENLQAGVRHRFQAQRRFAHFADALAQGSGVFGAEVRMMAEGHLEFVIGSAVMRAVKSCWSRLKA